MPVGIPAFLSDSWSFLPFIFCFLIFFRGKTAAICRRDKRHRSARKTHSEFFWHSLFFFAPFLPLFLCIDAERAGNTNITRIYSTERKCKIMKIDSMQKKRRQKARFALWLFALCCLCGMLLAFAAATTALAAPDGTTASGTVPSATGTADIGTPAPSATVTQPTHTPIPTPSVTAAPSVTPTASIVPSETAAPNPNTADQAGRILGIIIAIIVAVALIMVIIALIPKGSDRAAGRNGKHSSSNKDNENDNPRT